MWAVVTKDIKSYTGEDKLIFKRGEVYEVYAEEDNDGDVALWYDDHSDWHYADSDLCVLVHQEPYVQIFAYTIYYRPKLESGMMTALCLEQAQVLVDERVEKKHALSGDAYPLSMLRFEDDTFFPF